MPARPTARTLTGLRDEARGCRACPLWRHGTQTVFGEGGRRARVMLVGEQPGDKEDLAGHPFVGPAGALLDQALREAGVDRSAAYVTNAVKHFKNEPSGRGAQRRRIHKTPNRTEIAACLPWLEAEVRAVKPKILVCLGATAAKALIGPSFKVSVERGTFRASPLPWLKGIDILATVHPSSLLRTPDPEARRVGRAAFVKDLRLVSVHLKKSPAGR